jgi:hypothetical protein
MRRTRTLVMFAIGTAAGWVIGAWLAYQLAPKVTGDLGPMHFQQGRT